MNIFEKLQKIKLELLSCDLKKSGENKFAGFKYYELGDIMPAIIKLCDKYKVCTYINFDENKATLALIDCEKDVNNGENIGISAPMEKLEIRGANVVQNLGGTQTYMRRYLYMAMFDITENDVFDAVSGKIDNNSTKFKNAPKIDPKKYCCAECGAEFKSFEYNGHKYTSKQTYDKVLSQSKDGKARCKPCRKKLNLEEIYVK